MSGDFLVCCDVANVAGSVPAKCAQCGARVVIAPSGQRARRERNLTVICVDCAGVDVTNFREKVEPMSPEQLAEWIAYWAQWQ